MEEVDNFLVKLLNLEVAGKDAISAPGNWATEPLLNIETDVNQAIDDIAPFLISKKEVDTGGVWWFLVGSPGNGKSAAVGSLVRTLENQYGAQFREPKAGGKLGRKLSELKQNEIPYQMELYEAGNNYATALFAQDASVVPNPYEKYPNTGTALIELLKSATAKGQSIVVCANRGIIERALQHKGVKEEPWYQALKAIRDNKTANPIEFGNATSANPIFSGVKVEVTPLDEKSIVADGTFAKLITEAISNPSWDDCNGCESSSLCPFKKNRDWLKNDDGISRFSNVVRYAELISGQAIVFREALALISLILAGSSRDYKQITPCGWVEKKVKKGAFFSLLSRRIYMILFKSQSPLGLRLETSDREKQLETLSKSSSNLGDLSKRAIDALSQEQIATDIGLKRFLSLDGVFSELDPVRENQGKKLEQRWNLAPDIAHKLAEEQPLISDIEKQCFSVWADCEKSIDHMDQKGLAHEYYRELRHWITSVTYRLGFFAEGKMLFQDELKEYQRVLDLDDAKLSDDDDELIYDLEKSFAKFAFGSENHKKIAISDLLTVHGPKISDQLTPKIHLKDSRKTRLIMSIGDSYVEISPRSFAWLRRKDRTGMSDQTFPPEVQQVANDIRYKAASSIDYAFIESGINLDIKKPDDSLISLERRNGRLRQRDNS
jgi:hypothetical protein